MESPLTDEVLNAGGSDDDIRRIETDKTLRRSIVELIVKARKEVKGLFRVTVDYSQTLEQMIATGKYDWKNPDITAKHFPVSSSKSGTEEMAIELIKFDRDMQSDDVVCELDKMGLRPADLPELLAFGAKYPEKQHEFPIIALGSVWQGWDGNRLVPYLDSDSGGRNLGTDFFGSRWDSLYRFAAVRK